METYDDYVRRVSGDPNDPPASRALWEASERYDRAWRAGSMARYLANRNPHVDSVQDACGRANDEERAAFRALAYLVPGVEPIQGGLT